MIVWPAKDPAEVLDFTWIVPLDSGDEVVSYTAAVSSGTVVIDSDDSTSPNVRLWFSGGTADEISYLNLTATTTGGRTFREAAVLPVIDRASEVLADFRLRYPAFAAVDDGLISFQLVKAVDLVGTNWPASIQTNARLSYAAHRLAENGALPSAIPMGVTSFRSGSFSASVSDGIASLTGLESTVYGREYLILRRRAFAGPRLAWTPPTAID